MHAWGNEFEIGNVVDIPSWNGLQDANAMEGFEIGDEMDTPP